MKYGVTAATRPDSVWGRSVRWRCDKHGNPLAFDSVEEAQEAAQAFNGQQGPLNHIYENTAAPLEQEEKPQWTMGIS